MGRILLDTTVLIDILREGPAVERFRSLRRQGDMPYTSAVNVEEVVRGLRRGEEGGADRLFGGIGEASLGLNEGRQAGIWRQRYAREGVTLSQPDCLVAAAAHAIGAVLATGNPRDFPMEELTVEHWPVGE